MVVGVEGDSVKSEGRMVLRGDRGVVWCLSNCGRYWPGGGRGGSPLEGIASPGVGRTRLEESQRIGRHARMTRATPRVVVAARSWWQYVRNQSDQYFLIF